MSLPPPDSAFSFTSLKMSWRGLGAASLVPGLAGSWLGLLGSWHWVFDLCTHFRWQAFVVSGLALLGALVWRRRILMGAALLTLALNVWLFTSTPAPAQPTAVDPGFKVRVVSLNVLTSNRDHAAVLSFLQQSDADVIFLMETDRTWKAALEPLLKTHPHHRIQPRDDNFGIACYSRLPVEQMTLLSGETLVQEPTPGHISGSIEVQLTVAGKAWTFLGVHPVPPMGADYHQARNLQLQALAQRIARSNRPVLIAGDLNATPWSSGYRALLQGTALQAAPDSWKPSWKTATLLGIPIDQALTTPPLALLSRSIGPEVGSDHRAQILELAWSAGP
jgi:hypothetical protein